MLFFSATLRTLHPMTWLALAVSSSPDRAACLLCRRLTALRQVPQRSPARSSRLVDDSSRTSRTPKTPNNAASSGVRPAQLGPRRWSARPRRHHGARQPRRGGAGARARHGAGLAAGIAALLREPAAGHFELGGKTSLCAVCTQYLPPTVRERPPANL